MPKKKFYPPNDTGTKKRRFRCLLFQRPKAYPNRPRSNKNNLIKPIRRAEQTVDLIYLSTQSSNI